MVVAGIVALDEVEKEAEDRVGLGRILRLMAIDGLEETREPVVERLEAGCFVVFEFPDELRLHLAELFHHDGDHGCVALLSMVWIICH